MKIKNLKENVLNNINLLVSQVEFKITKKEEDYAKVTFSDGSSKISAFIWNINKKDFDLKAGTVYNIYCYKQEFNSRPVLKIVEYKECFEKEIINMFIKSAIISSDEIKEFIFNQIDLIKDHDLKKMTKDIVCSHESKYFKAPAAANNHHAYINGMSYHVYNMLKVLHIFDDSKFDKDLLISSIILHDIGKCFELENNLVIKYTQSGNLLGHIAIGFEIVFSYISKNDITNVSCLKVLDLILSHHGKIEYGNLKQCFNCEEKLINLIDTIDAYLNAFIEKLEEIDINCWSDNVYALSNRKVFKHEISDSNNLTKKANSTSDQFIAIYKSRYKHINKDIIDISLNYFDTDFVKSYSKLLLDRDLFSDNIELFRTIKHMLISNNVVNDVSPMHGKIIEAEMLKWILKIQNYDYL